MEQTTERRWHEVWREQCEAAKPIGVQHGVESAFDYVVGEKLLTCVEAGEEQSEFARALPQFVSELRHMFTPEEIDEYLARVERERLPARHGRDGRPRCGAGRPCSLCGRGAP